MNGLEKEWSTEKKIKAGRKRKGISLFTLQVFVCGLSPLILALASSNTTEDTVKLVSNSGCD